MTQIQHQLMVVQGKLISPPMVLPYGGADNYFPEPGGWDGSVWSGTRFACPEWIYAISNGLCDITGDPVRAVPHKKRCILRSIQAWDVEAPGVVRIREWHNRPSQVRSRIEIPVNPGVSSSTLFGIYGVDIGQMPFVQTTVKASLLFTYDIA